jgi:hypothetical protein
VTPFLLTILLLGSKVLVGLLKEAQGKDCEDGCTDVLEVSESNARVRVNKGKSCSHGWRGTDRPGAWEGWTKSWQF